MKGLPESRRSLPIGVFDSGLGGLTVVRALRKRLPNESILYFGDTARVPYGTKSRETIRRFTSEITNFLVRQRVKMVVAACNSCSATSLDCVSENFRGPVLGVIQPGVRAALEITQNLQIGVIGTRATISSGAYEQAIGAACPEAQVYSTACPLFVPLAEEGMESHKAARLFAEDYLSPLLDQGIDVLILGCTHYPLLSETIREVVGENVAVVDSAEATAESVAAELSEKTLTSGISGGADLRAFVSDDPEGFRRFWERLMPGDPIWVGTAQPERVGAEMFSL